MSHLPNAKMEHLLRELAPQVLSAVMRRFNDFADAEDAVQEALIAAALQWPREGVPQNPKGWLFRVASRRMIDSQRSDLARRQCETETAIEAERAAAATPFSFELEQDDTLILLFMCCHSALTSPSAIALTLRAIGGLTTAEIAHAFMVPEATMAQRISRAKQSIKASGGSFHHPSEQEKTQRLRAVLHVLYLIFSEGYTSSVGTELQRPELAKEAIRLTKCVHTLLPDDPEVMGLLALMLLTDVRRATRSASNGEVVALTEQDRGRWDQNEIGQGVALLESALSKGAIGPYQLQAAIAALHDEAPRAEDTDWTQILALYEMLKHMSDNPMVRLNHAIAIAMVRGPAEGLKMLDEIDSEGCLEGHYRLNSVRANLLELAGDHDAAVVHYKAAAERTNSLPERNYLVTQAARLAEKMTLSEKA